MNKLGLSHLEKWLTNAQNNAFPRKQDQDCLDACICLLVGMLMAMNKDCLFVGNMDTGYMVVPYDETLYQEIIDRCGNSNPKRYPVDWIAQFKIA
ncbi:MAG: hypothetical protein A2061_09715 [Gallionellales bacterium GWA2_59_43]|nr:MAG: hypothetical protein A2061_09715 [Gallionellales bacterium GWA2_59_43]